jgi:hypothetical protein
MVIATLFAAAAGAASAAPVRHAGEWQTTIDTGRPTLVCFRKDLVIDQAFMLHSMATIPGGNCKMNRYTTVGPVTSSSMSCTVGGSLMTIASTTTVTAPDTMTSRSQSHGGAVPLNGKLAPLPDTDSTSVSRRLGPCKPGDPLFN